VELVEVSKRALIHYSSNKRGYAGVFEAQAVVKSFVLVMLTPRELMSRTNS
jgi:hypothetical protein